MTEVVKRYDCSSGGARFCQGCYTMEECEFGDHVEYEYYALLERECAKQKDRADAEQQAYDGLGRVLEAVKAERDAAPDLLQALEASNLLLRTQRHACESTQVCHMLDAHIARNNAAISRARGQS